MTIKAHTTPLSSKFRNIYILQKLKKGDEIPLGIELENSNKIDLTVVISATYISNVMFRVEGRTTYQGERANITAQIFTSDNSPKGYAEINILP